MKNPYKELWDISEDRDHPHSESATALLVVLGFTSAIAYIFAMFVLDHWINPWCPVAISAWLLLAAYRRVTRHE